MVDSSEMIGTEETIESMLSRLLLRIKAFNSSPDSEKPYIDVSSIECSAETATIGDKVLTHPF